MTSAPGWYQDPNDANSARYWDGNSWTSQTQPMDGLGGGGATPARPLWPWFIVGAVLLAAIGGGIWWLMRDPGSEPIQPTSPPRPSTSISAEVDPSESVSDPSEESSGEGATDPAETTPSDPETSPGAAADPDAEFSCHAGNGEYTRGEMPSYAAGGIYYEGIEGWGFSFDPEYWTFLNDHSAMGAIDIDGVDETSAGIAIGGLPKVGPTAELEQAALEALRCVSFTVGGSYPEWEVEPTVESVEIDGMRGARVAAMTSDGEYDTEFTVTVLDSGLDTQWGTVIAFQSNTDGAAAELAQALGTVRRG